MSQPNPRYDDGLQGTTTLSVYCYNNAQTYMCHDGDPGEDSTQIEWTDSDNGPLGSSTVTSFRKGTLNLQYTLIADELQSSANQIRPGYIVSFRARYYVCGNVKPKVVKNDVIKFSVAVMELQNPFIANLLTTLGQQKKVSLTANVANTINCNAIAARSNGTLSYSVESFNTAGLAVSGVTINANTGVLTVNIPASTVDVRVIATDTLDGNTQVGFGRYTPTAA